MTATSSAVMPARNPRWVMDCLLLSRQAAAPRGASAAVRDWWKGRVGQLLPLIPAHAGLREHFLMVVAEPLGYSKASAIETFRACCESRGGMRPRRTCARRLLCRSEYTTGEDSVKHEVGAAPRIGGRPGQRGDPRPPRALASRWSAPQNPAHREELRVTAAR